MSLRLCRAMLRVPAAALAVMAVAATGCHTVNDDRIPPYSVNLIFGDLGKWNRYGTPAALDYRRFILSERVPADYPYLIGETTGFGGVLLVGDVNGAPRAYDLACPVECRSDVRIVVDTELNNAYCPKCRSVYDIYTNYGAPIGGEAAERGYALRQYYVGAGGPTEYMVVRSTY